MNHNNLQQTLKISSLIKRYLRNELSQPEHEELQKWLKDNPDKREELLKHLEDSINNYDPAQINRFNSEQAFDKLLNRIGENELVSVRKNNGLRKYYAMAAAAVVLIAVTVGIIIFNMAQNKALVAGRQPAKPPMVQPKQVELVLADGRKVNLEAQGTGIVATQGQAVISKQQGNVLSYQPAEAPGTADNINATNKLVVPRGKQYQLLLPDGSKVWLNAQSTITFPSSFNKSERLVELTGEAYFEVAHFSAWPFRVKTQEQHVEVLGTKFNVTAYPEDRQSTTTLLSGSVKVYDQTAFRLLKPGELALKDNQKKGFTVMEADAAEAIAWKNGVLVFKDETIESLTQTLGRTFDVDFDIDEKLKGQHFGGSFLIKNGLPNLLRNLEQTDVLHFKVTGRRITVMP